MADLFKKISDFPKASAFGDTDLLLVSQNGATKVLTGDLLKSFATTAGVEAAKITNAKVDSSGILILTTTDGTTIAAGKVLGNDGISVAGASINSSYHLILRLSDGKEIDAGYCRGASGAGSGDMQESEYDPNGTIKSAGGIEKYIAEKSFAAEYIPVSEKGVSGGVATLGTDGKVPVEQISTVAPEPLSSDVAVTTSSSTFWSVVSNSSKAYKHYGTVHLNIKTTVRFSNNGTNCLLWLSDLPESTLNYTAEIGGICNMSYSNASHRAYIVLSGFNPSTEGRHALQCYLLDHDTSVPAGTDVSIEGTLIYLCP